MNENVGFIEQLYYTSSTRGLLGTLGFQVRAASREFLNTRSARYAAVSGHLYYQLPRGVSRYSIEPDQAPVSLSFCKAGNELILVHKTYVGDDPIGRPGNYFVHLLAGLPPDFTAAEAIGLWGQDVWRRDDTHLGAGELELRTLSAHELLSRSSTLLDIRTPGIASCPGFEQYLCYFIQAFLALPGGQQMYIAAAPDTVASLLSGLTLALPASMTREVTFSTYEHDIGKSHDILVVGTCWAEQSPTLPGAGFDLPEVCYGQAGLAMNCYTGRKTPLPGDERFAWRAEQFATFAAARLLGDNRVPLSNFLWHAESLGAEDAGSLLLAYYLLTTGSSEQLDLDLEDLDLVLGKPLFATYFLHKGNVSNAIIDRCLSDDEWWETKAQRAIETLCEQGRNAAGNSDGPTPLEDALHELSGWAAARLTTAIERGSTGDASRLLDDLVASIDPGLAQRRRLQLFQELSTSRNRNVALPYELYGRELHFWLLSEWLELDAGEGSYGMSVEPWLRVPMSDLGDLLALPLPAAWLMRAAALGILSDGGNEVVPGQVVAQYHHLFASALKFLAANLWNQNQGWNFGYASAIEAFLSRVVDAEYEGSVRLVAAVLDGLRALLDTDGQEDASQFAGTLVQKARLLPNQRKELLEEDELQALPLLFQPELYVQWVNSYLKDLNASDLRRKSCIDMLTAIHIKALKPNLLPAKISERAQEWNSLCVDWLRISDALEDAGQFIRGQHLGSLQSALIRLDKKIGSAAKSELRDELVGALVRGLHSKEDLSTVHRVMGNSFFGAGSHLLAEMARYVMAAAPEDPYNCAQRAIPFIRLEAEEEIFYGAQEAVHALIGWLPDEAFAYVERDARNNWSTNGEKKLQELKRRLRTPGQRANGLLNRLFRPGGTANMVLVIWVATSGLLAAVNYLF
jgi:hypothetical protein